MAQKNVQLRLASPYEHRLAIREELGFYNAAALGAVYEFAEQSVDVKLAATFVQPLKKVLNKFPHLGVVLGSNDQSPAWERVPSVELDHHIVILDEIASHIDETIAIENTLPSIVDAPFTGSTPPWRVVVLPLAPKDEKPRAFIALVISHAIGDGGSGLAFHHTFLGALRQSTAADNHFTFAVAEYDLPEPFDTPDRLPVSPEFMNSLMSSSIVGPGTWTGSKVFLNKDEGLHTKIRVLEIEPQQVETALRVSRAHGTKLTPLLHQLVTRALSRVVKDETVTDFASQTAIDLRAASGVGLAWGIYLSGHAVSHPRADASAPITHSEWDAVSKLSKKLAEVASTLDDQVIGMLRYVPNQKDSLASKTGSIREGSYALSNMLAVDGGKEGEKVRITKLVVATSAAVPSAPLSFCLVSVKGGSLICTVSWQPGALDVPDEDKFVEDILSSLKADLASFQVSVL